MVAKKFLLVFLLSLFVVAGISARGEGAENGAIVVTPGLPGPDVAVPIGVAWEEFSFTVVGVPAAGCAPADPAGGGCAPSSGANSVFVGAPPWTFTAPAGGVLLTVTDAFLRGDSFNVFDFGVFIGATPLVAVGGSCGDNPDNCVADPLVSRATFALAAGLHSITITPSASPFGGGVAYFRLDPIPLSFAGTPGQANCHGKSVSALAHQYGDMDAAAAALGFPSVQALQDAIRAFCGN